MPGRVLVAPDSFKGTFSATEVAAGLARGLRSGGREAIELPVADGGEGTLDAILAALGGERRTLTVSGPLGSPVEAAYGLLPDGSAIVESAQSSGLGLVPKADRDAWTASTHGTGELVAAAVREGASRVLVAVGGTASTDGGAGAVAALEGAEVSGLVVLCDVRTPWEDAPRVFGPQKGADPGIVAQLERRLAELAARAPRDPTGIPLAGAGGGLAGGLWAYCDAELVPGAPFVLDAVGFDEKLKEAALCITGEGSLDAQTTAGKLVAEIAARCLTSGVPCHAIVGRNELGPGVLGLASVTEAGTIDELEAAGRALAGTS